MLEKIKEKYANFVKENNRYAKTKRIYKLVMEDSNVDELMLLIASGKQSKESFKDCECGCCNWLDNKKMWYIIVKATEYEFEEIWKATTKYGYKWHGQTMNKKNTTKKHELRWHLYKAA